MKTLYIKGCLPSPELADAVLLEGDEVWTINVQPLPLEKPITRHFSLHGLEHELESHGRKYLLWLSKSAAPVYLFRDQIPLWDGITYESGGLLPRPADVRAFPLASIEEALLTPRRYFTGSFAYLLAYALYCDFDAVHIVGVAFSDSGLWDSRLQAAEWVEGGYPLDYAGKKRSPRRSPEYEQKLETYRKANHVIDDLRGMGTGDESWARECIMYWCGRLEQAGIRIAVGPTSQLFHNKWIKTHCKYPDDPKAECGLYGLCECIGGK
jgi:hypothetical protein